MGLKERRAIQGIKEAHFESFTKDLEAVVGGGVEVEVDWDSLATDGQDHLYEEWIKICFTPVLEGFKAICIDDMGKTAVQDSVKKIVIQNKSGAYGARAFTFDGGVLTVDHDMCNVDDIDTRTKALVDVVESAL